MTHSIPLIWTGSDWLPYTASIAKDDGSVYPEQSKASVGLVESLKYTHNTSVRVAPSIPIKELNAAYGRYSLNPDEEENLKATIYAYVKGSFIPAQIRKLLWGKHEIAVEEEDIIMEFTAYMFGMLPNYKNSGKMQNWITRSWKKFFFPDEQRKVIEYANKARWMNEVPVNDRSYEHLHRCVSLLSCHSDAVESHRASCKSSLLTKEILTTDPSSPWFQLTDASKEMLLARLRGETNKQTAKRLGYNRQHVGRLVEAAVEEAKQINETGHGGGVGWN